jgi:hypothetical protein
MSMFKLTLDSILKARANILKRPKFWAATSGLVLSAVLVGEYLANPQKYTGGNDLDAATNPSNQNPLDNLPTQNTPASNNKIFEALPKPTGSTQTSVELRSPGSAASNSPPLPGFFPDQLSTAAQKAKPERSQSSSFSSSFSSGTQRDRPSESQLPSLYPSPSSSGLPSPAASRNNASPSLRSPAGSQSTLSPARSFSQPSVENSSSDSSFSAPAGSFRQNSFGQQESSPQGLSRSQFTPQRSPSPGTTGYTLPPTSRTSTPSVSPSSSSGNLQPIPGQISPQTAPAGFGQSPAGFGQSSNYGRSPSPDTGRSTNPSAQPSFAPSSQPMPSPFSVPRSVPGRSTGGGQINTFSNP